MFSIDFLSGRPFRFEPHIKFQLTPMELAVTVLHCETIGCLSQANPSPWWCRSSAHYKEHPPFSHNKRQVKTTFYYHHCSDTVVPCKPNVTVSTWLHSWLKEKKLLVYDDRPIAEKERCNRRYSFFSYLLLVFFTLIYPLLFSFFSVYHSRSLLLFDLPSIISTE